MSPVRRVTLGRGGEEHDAANAALGKHVPDRFSDRTAVVTGAGSGIGRAVAERLASEGAAVAVLDVVGASATRTADTIADAGGRAAAYRCDVTDETSVGETMAALGQELGAPSVVCNVAGIGGFYRTDEMPLEKWQQILDVNLTGPFLVCRAALPSVIDSRGSIVNVASNTALMGQAYSAAYCASKAGLLMFSKALAAELLPTGVRVNVVAPGGVDTPLIGAFSLPEGIDPKILEKMMTPMGFSTPAEIAASVAFLASDESSYTTGSVLSVDGGLTI